MRQRLLRPQYSQNKFLSDASYMFFFFSSRRRHTRLQGDWSSDVCSSDLRVAGVQEIRVATSVDFKPFSALRIIRTLSPAGLIANSSTTRKAAVVTNLPAIDRKSVV